VYSLYKQLSIAANLVQIDFDNIYINMKIVRIDVSYTDANVNNFY